MRIYSQIIINYIINAFLILAQQYDDNMYIFQLMPHYRERSGRKGNRQSKYHRKYKPNSFVPMQKPNLTGSTQYLSLTPEDMIYLGNLNRFKSYDFQAILRKIVMDLNILLYFKYDDFWTEIKGSQSLKLSLHSCLLIFTRKGLGKHQQQKSIQTSELQNLYEDQIFKLWSLLTRIVLFLYHRIICESRGQQRCYIYDNWLLDVPKMFNLIEIYGDSSPLIIEQIISAAFNNIPSYKDDIFDMIFIIRENIIECLKLNMDFQFTQKIVMQSDDHYDNPMISFSQNLVKSIFTAYDIYHSLANFLRFFPKFHQWQLITDSYIYINLIESYIMFVENIQHRWQIKGDLKIILRQMIQQTRQQMLNFLCYSFSQLRNLLNKQLDHSIWQAALKVYTQICEIFVQNHKQPGRHWERLIILMIEDNPSQQMFFINRKMDKILSRNQRKALSYCLRFQQNYKQSIEGKFAEQLQVLNNTIFEGEGENFSELILDDSQLNNQESILLALNQQIKPNNLLIQKKHPKLLNKIYTQYDDEPQQQIVSSYSGIYYQSRQYFQQSEEQQSPLNSKQKQDLSDLSFSYIGDEDIMASVQQNKEKDKMDKSFYDQDYSISYSYYTTQFGNDYDCSMSMISSQISVFQKENEKEEQEQGQNYNTQNCNGQNYGKYSKKSKEKSRNQGNNNQSKRYKNHKCSKQLNDQYSFVLGESSNESSNNNEYSYVLGGSNDKSQVAGIEDLSFISAISHTKLPKKKKFIPKQESHTEPKIQTDFKKKKYIQKNAQSTQSDNTNTQKQYKKNYVQKQIHNAVKKQDQNSFNKVQKNRNKKEKR